MTPNRKRAWWVQAPAGSQKWGGTKGLLEAVNAFLSLAKVQEDLKVAKKSLSESRTQLQQTQAGYNHLLPIIGMLETLMYDLNFNQEAITQL